MKNHNESLAAVVILIFCAVLRHLYFCLVCMSTLKILSISLAWKTAFEMDLLYSLSFILNLHLDLFGFVYN